MRYTIEGFSQAEAVKFRRTEIVKDSKGNEKEKVVTLDCTDLVILRWLVDFWPGMMKVEIGGKQYAWLSYKHAIEDMPLLGIKKGMFALRLKKLVDFGILTHKTVKSGGTFSYYGFGPAYMRLADTDHVQDVEEGVSNILDTPAQNISDQINQSIKDPSTKDVYMGKPKKKKAFDPPTREEIREHVKEKGYHFDPDHFFDYYDASDWHLQGGKRMTSWKQACVTWERNWKNSDQGKPKAKRSSYGFDPEKYNYFPDSHEERANFRFDPDKYNIGYDEEQGA